MSDNAEVNPLKPIIVKPKFDVPYEDLTRRKQQKLDGFIHNRRIDEK